MKKLTRFMAMALVLALVLTSLVVTLAFAENTVLYTEDYQGISNYVTSVPTGDGNSTFYLKDNDNIMWGAKAYGNNSGAQLCQTSCDFSSQSGKIYVSAKLKFDSSVSYLGTLTLFRIGKNYFQMPLRFEGDTGTLSINYYENATKVGKVGNGIYLKKNTWYTFGILYDLSAKTATLEMYNADGSTRLLQLTTAIDTAQYTFKNPYFRMDPYVTAGVQQRWYADDWKIESVSEDEDPTAIIYQNNYQSATPTYASIDEAPDDTTSYLNESGNISMLAKTYGNNDTNAHFVKSGATIPNEGIVQMEARVKFNTNIYYIGQLRVFAMGNQRFHFQVRMPGDTGSTAISYYDKDNVQQSTGVSAGTFTKGAWYLFRETLDFDNKTAKLEIFEADGTTLKAAATGTLAGTNYTAPQFRMDYYREANSKQSFQVDNWMIKKVVAKPSVSVCAESPAESAQYTENQQTYGGIRFMYEIDTKGAQVDNFGAYIIPWDLVSANPSKISESSARLVKYEPEDAVEDGTTFSADLLKIPVAAFTREICSVPFINNVFDLSQKQLKTVE